MTHVLNFADGAFGAAQDTLTLTDPATGEALGKSVLSGQSEVDKAMASGCWFTRTCTTSSSPG
ncbi:hypothetical protein ACQPXB_13965 [Amycolatopsis sp. CA-161197]|uniref:hypothetical protein n=1 Tax=Amycolatopsis sp. CA-161197 TaxID=3239922 RepID=UPI003D8E1E02